MTITLEFPMRLYSEANQGGKLRAKIKRKVAQKNEVFFEWKRQVKQKINPPCKVRLTRIGPRALDGDNLQGSFKYVRDTIARMIGIDDGDPLIEWFYYQRKGAYGVQIEIEEI